jgi:hypothetical protein
MTASPEQRYRTRLAEWEADTARRERRYNQLSAVRAGLFFLIIGLAWLALARGTPPLWWAALPLAGFLLVALQHERIAVARDQARRGVAWYRLALDRLADRWAGQGMTGESYRDAEHLYADDLDLFGTGSLFELLCTARTAIGQETLARWLKQPAAPELVTPRQEAVRELAGRPDLREELALAEGQAGGPSGRMVLRVWGEGPALGVPSWARLAAFLAGLANVLALVGATWFGLPALAALAVLLASALLSVRLRQPVETIVAAAGRPARELHLMAVLIARLERERFTAPLLVSLHDAFEGQGGMAVSARIARLHRLVGLLDSRTNQLFRPIAWLLLWTTQCALAIETWRRESGGAVGRWIEALGEFEALAALATFADEHPDYAWPEVTGGRALLEATALAHPLLARAGTVANDLALGDDLRLMVVSGSNMSGKSTMLRAIGVNAVMAQAGAPVRARDLRLSGLAIGASFRTVDSLREGQSRFYAEIARLRRIMDLLDGDRPVLFLLDELLSGTNSHDRLIGAGALVDHLVEQGAIGLITTHDLALAGIADGLGPRAVNVHFEDHLEEGRLAFDYRLRPGVVQRSNALELMRSVGLDV